MKHCRIYCCQKAGCRTPLPSPCVQMIERRRWLIRLKWETMQWFPLIHCYEGILTCHNSLITLIQSFAPNLVLRNGKLLQSDTLEAKFHRPKTHLFRYLPFRHAYNAQFGNTILRIKMSDLEPLLRDNSLVKVLSTIYKQLFTDVGGLLACCRAAWVAVFPQLDGDDWNDFWKIHFSRLLSTRDHLIQYKFTLHLPHSSQIGQNISYPVALLLLVHLIQCRFFTHVLKLCGHPIILEGGHWVCRGGHCYLCTASGWGVSPGTCLCPGSKKNDAYCVHIIFYYARK